MQTVAAIVDRQHLRRMLGVAQRLVEIIQRLKVPQGQKRPADTDRLRFQSESLPGDRYVVRLLRQFFAASLVSWCKSGIITGR
jgi:hypothetical protein